MLMSHTFSKLKMYETISFLVLLFVSLLLVILVQFHVYSFAGKHGLLALYPPAACHSSIEVLVKDIMAVVKHRSSKCLHSRAGVRKYHLAHGVKVPFWSIPHARHQDARLRYHKVSNAVLAAGVDGGIVAEVEQISKEPHSQDGKGGKQRNSCTRTNASQEAPSQALLL